MIYKYVYMIVNVYAYKRAARRKRYKHKTARNEAQTKVGAGSAEKGAHIGRYKQLIYKQEVGRKARAASTSQETERKPKHKKKRREKASSAMVQAPMYKQEPVGEDFTIS